jgi:hypothetical protein
MIKKSTSIILALFVSYSITTFAQTNCFQYFNTNSTKQNDTLAYLLMDCNYYIFPDLIGVKKYNDDSTFQAMFCEKYTNYGMQQFSFVDNDSTSTNFAVMSNNTTIIIIFRGSETKGGFRNAKKDWLLTDAKCKMFKIDTFNNSYVHKGFWNSYQSVEDTLLKTENKKIFITGHSLGGALAILAAVDLLQHQLKPFGVYTFANPRVGTECFADYYALLDIPTYRYVNENDLVPMLPPVKRFHRIMCPEKNKGDCGKYQHVGITYNIHKDGSIIGNDEEIKVPNKTYKLGKIKRHDLGEYCNRIYQMYFPTDTIGVLPKPPVKIK